MPTTLEKTDVQRKADLKKKNELFKSMKKKQRAVAVAKDVLKQLRAKKIIAIRGDYVAAEFAEDEEALESKFDEDENIPLEEITKIRCHCCAIGATMLSFSRLFNRMFVNSVCNIVPDRETLSQAFSWRTIVLMESAFEGTDFCCDAESARGTDIRISEKTMDAACEFGLEDEADTMEAIMKNIIKNDGEFVPSKA